jgi:hypothetical protein
MTRKPVLPNPTQPRAPIELDGQTYNLAFDFHAICEAERVAGVNLLHAIEFDGLNAQQFRGLLYAALLKFQPSTTLQANH